MMMETVVYSREYLFVKELYDKGELGKIQFLQASHQQDMDGWPNYWPGLPPMHYATHCVGPCLALHGRARPSTSPASARARIREELIREVQLARSPSRRPHQAHATPTSSARIYRSLFDTARQYRESFDVYGSKKSFEWPLIEGEEPVIHTAKKPEPEIPQRVKVPDYAHLLARADPPLHDEGRLRPRRSTRTCRSCRAAATAARTRTWCTSSSSALVEDRDPFPNAVQSANWTCVGHLCARVGAEGRRDRETAGVHASSECRRRAGGSRSSASGSSWQTSSPGRSTPCRGGRSGSSRRSRSAAAVAR